MLKRRIIPCLDIKNGRVVKGVHFAGLRDAGDPIEAARIYDNQGADELCLLDITATTEGRETFVEIVRRVAAQIYCPLTVGGGIRRDDDVRRLLNAGADKVAINSAAVTNPPLIERLAKKYGSQCIVGAVDVRRMPPIEKAPPPTPAPTQAPAAGLMAEDPFAGAPLPGDPFSAPPPAAAPTPAPVAPLAPVAASAPLPVAAGVDVSSNAVDDDEPLYEVVVHGGTRSTGLEALHWCEMLVELGAGEILLTSMDRDGTRDGYDLYITREVSRRVSVPIIASGGVGSLEHLREGLAASEGEADGALAASIFHFGLFTIAQAKHYLAERGIAVRPPEDLHAGV